ncbi:P-loop containing nucleoside triphosphate hydrolase protein [Sparassis latifolia]
MEARSLLTVTSLSGDDRTALKKGNILTVADLMLTSPGDLVKKCRFSLNEAQKIVDLVCRELAHQPRMLEDVVEEGEEKFTTGDLRLDETLGGGIRPGMLWEVVGESAAGKTQLALQLCLMVQLPLELGGLSGSACILTTSAHLPTTRLIEIADTHALLSSTHCGLSDIHTIKTPEIPILLHVLSTTLPTFISQQASRDGAKPVKLLIVDALTELFHSDSKTSKHTLFERSKNLSEISALLYDLTRRHRLAVLVLNEVIDVFGATLEADAGFTGDMLYRDQARFFGRADSVPGEERKEAALGLVWANQVNARIMMSRTGRTRHIDVSNLASSRRKRRRLEDASDGAQRVGDLPMFVRRLSVIFSCVALPASLDYVVCDQGIVTVPEEPAFPEPPRAVSTESVIAPGPTATPAQTPYDVSPYDVGLISGNPKLVDSNARPAEDAGPAAESIEAEDGPRADEDEWDQYWKDADMDDSLYRHVDTYLAPPINATPD